MQQLPKQEIWCFFPPSLLSWCYMLVFWIGNNHTALFFYCCHFCSKSSNCRVPKCFLVSSSWPFRVFNGLTSESRLPSPLNGAFVGVNLPAQLGSQVYATFPAVVSVFQTTFAQMLLPEQSGLLMYRTAKCWQNTKHKTPCAETPNPIKWANSPTA